MAKKRRRKLTVDGRNFLWYLKEDDDGHGLVLHVLSEDKTFLVKYEVGQPVGDEYLVVIGPGFAGAPTGGAWRRFRCPRFELDSAVTPNTVRELIAWVHDPSKQIREVTWEQGGLRV